MGTIAATRARLPNWHLWGIAIAIALAISIALVGTGIVSLVAIGVARLGGHHLSVKSPGIALASTLVQDAAMIASVFIAARMMDGRLWLGGFGFLPLAVSRGRAIAFGVATWLGFIAFTAAWTAVVGKSGKQRILEDLGTHRSAAYWAASFVLIVVVAPLAEEVLFRGFLFSTFWRRFPLGLAAAITGVLFGALHLGGSPVLLTVPLGVLGLLLCLLRAATGSLVPCLIVHAVNNTLAFGIGEKVGAGWLILMLVFSIGSVSAIGIEVVRWAYTRGNGVVGPPAHGPAEDGDGPLPAGPLPPPDLD